MKPACKQREQQAFEAQLAKMAIAPTEVSQQPISTRFNNTGPPENSLDGDTFGGGFEGINDDHTNCEEPPQQPQYNRFLRPIIHPPKEPSPLPPDYSEIHPGAGKVIGNAPSHYQSILEHQLRVDKGVFYPFSCQTDVDIADWLHDSGLSRDEIDKFLHLKYVQERPPSFGSAKTLHHYIGILPNAGARWKSVPVMPQCGSPTKPIVLLFRDPVEAVEQLLSEPTLKDDLVFAPIRDWSDEKKTSRQYSEMFTGDWWWAEQAILPIDGTLIPIIIYSDKTRLTTLGGDKQAWPVYLTIGNIRMGVRNLASRKCWLPMAYLPVTYFDDPKAIQGCLQARLFHQCLSIVFECMIPIEEKGKHMADSTGAVRLSFLRIGAYISDHPEQGLVTCAAPGTSATFEAGHKDLDELELSPRRTYEGTIELIEQLRQDFDPTDVNQVEECLKTAKALGLNGVLFPFWECHVGFQPWRVAVPDILHGLHRFFRDHPHKWTRRLIGMAEYDLRLKSLQPLVGIRHFREGIGHLSQWTGREDRELQRTCLAIAVGCPKVTKEVQMAFRAILDVIYLLQYRSHNQDTLAYFDKAFDAFHKYKDSWIKMGGRRGKKGPINHFRIPKLHALHAYRQSIIELGSSPQYSTEHGERAHIPFAKDLFASTNHKDFFPQMCRILDRQEKLRQFKGFLAWTDIFCHDQETNKLLAQQSGEEAESLKLWRSEFAKSFARPSKHLPFKDPTDPNAIYSLTKKPHLPSQSIILIARLYKLPDLIPALRFFRHILDLPSDQSSSAASSAALRFSDELPPNSEVKPLTTTHINVWSHFQLHSKLVQDPDRDADPTTVQALPPNEKYPKGRCNFVLVHNTAEAESTGLEGYIVAQVRIIFILLGLPPKHHLENKPLAYVQWFREPHAFDQALQMWVVRRDLNENGKRQGEIIELSTISRRIQLIPRYGARIPSFVTEHNSVEQDHMQYTINSFVDKEVYQSVY